MPAFDHTYRNYAEKFYAKTSLATTETNTISSALGSWINLAFFSVGLEPHLTPENQFALENELGCSLPEAKNHLKTLLAANPKAVTLALGFWTKPEYAHQDFNTYLRNQILDTTNNVSLGDIPTKAKLDDWVTEHSLGIITEFPVDNPQDLVSLLANVLATKIDWDEPYKTTETVDATWGQKLLTQPKTANLYLGLTNQGKPYAIHWKEDETKTVTVYSIIGDETLLASELYALVTDFEVEKETKTVNLTETRNVSNAHKFMALETDFLEFIPTQSTSPSCSTTVELPAWEASQSHDLDDLEVGFTVLKKLWLETYNIDVQTKQVAKAAYHKNGFEAAALTYSLMRAAGMMTLNKVFEIKVNFKRPYVVVAYSNEDGFTHLPLFVAQVKEANSVD